MDVVKLICLQFYVSLFFVLFYAKLNIFLGFSQIKKLEYVDFGSRKSWWVFFDIS